MNIANNQQFEMTRRYPSLAAKVLRRDSEIVVKMIAAYDTNKDPDKVLSIYLKEHKNLSDERFWEFMRSVWILCGTVENQGTFRKLMQSKRREKHYFSTPEEAKKLREMPETFTVYRACNLGEESGLSWTTLFDYASQYQSNFGKAKIISKEIHKSEVFAFIERNAEFEIIIL